MIVRLLRHLQIFAGNLGRAIRTKFESANVPIVSAPPRTLVPHIAFALALIVPVLLICALIAKQWVASEQDQLDERIAELTASVTDDLGYVLDDRIRALRSLATSPALDQADAHRFERQAREFLRQDGFGLLLRDRAGHILVDTLQDQSPKEWRPPLSALPLAGQVRISDLIQRKDGQSPIIAIDVPVTRVGAVEFVLTTVLSVDAFNSILRSNRVTGELMATIADRDGRVMTRSPTAQTEVGARLKSFEERPGESGRWFGWDASGEPLRVAYRRLPQSGWLISVGITQAAFLAPRQRILWTLGGLTFTLLALAFALTAPILRRV